MKRKLTANKKLKRSMMLKCKISHNSDDVKLKCSSESYADVFKLKKVGQEIALRRRISLSKLNKRQTKKYWKKHLRLINVGTFSKIGRTELKSKPVLVDI
jgi:DNA invertase Pin-like site-specific DNA recombinase